MTEPDTDNGTPEAPQKTRQQTLVVIWINVAMALGALLYLAWQWYAHPGAPWPHWIWNLMEVALVLWIIDGIVIKTSSK